MDTDAEEQSDETPEHEDNEVECPKCFNPHARGVMLRRDVEFEDGPLKTHADLPNPTIICNKCGARTEMIPSEAVEKMVGGIMGRMKADIAEMEERRNQARKQYMRTAKSHRRAILINVVLMIFFAALMGGDLEKWMLRGTSRLVALTVHALLTLWYVIVLNKMTARFSGELAYNREIRDAKRAAKKRGEGRKTCDE